MNRELLSGLSDFTPTAPQPREQRYARRSPSTSVSLAEAMRGGALTRAASAWRNWCHTDERWQEIDEHSLAGIYQPGAVKRQLIAKSGGVRI